ncbi:MAG: ABC transporter substrate-binding protein [Burkholderiales bacterium]|nr:MAG: ABC transporter substrate-binding protein [Burkholderiales bacterium]
MKRRLFLSLSLAGLCLAVAPASAQQWPSGPVKVIVPYGPGSTPDMIARIVSEHLSARLGKPFVVENKAGASGNIGTDAVAKATPDGQTIGVSIAGPLAVNTLLFRSMPYDPARDIAPITIAATQPSVLVVGSRLPVADTAELVARLARDPGKYNFSSMGAGSISHLAVEAIAAKAGTEIVHVPYAGSTKAVMAVLSGEVDLAVLPAAAVMPQVKAGKLRALAVATAKRSAALPDLPTLAEGGIRDVQADAWMGFIAPAKTPEAIVARLHDEIVAVLADPGVQDKLRGLYMDVVANSPSEFKATLKGDLDRWRPIVEKHGIRLD